MSNVFYHVTSRDRLRDILEHGLQPDEKGSGTLIADRKIREIHGCTPVYLAEKSSDMLRNMREYHDDPVLLKVELPEGAELQPDFATLSFKGGWFTNIQDGPLDDDPITGEYHVYSSGKEGSEAFEERFWHLMDDDQKIPVSDFLEPDSEAARIAREFTGCVVTPAGIAPGNIEHVDFKELDPKRSLPERIMSWATEIGARISGYFQEKTPAPHDSPDGVTREEIPPVSAENPSSDVFPEVTRENPERPASRESSSQDDVFLKKLDAIRQSQASREATDERPR